MPEIHELSTTDADNTTRFPENQAPSTVNNGARALEGIIARFFGDLQGPNLPVATLSGSVIQFTANRVSITATGTTSNYIANGMFGFIMGDNGAGDGVSVRINDIQTLGLRDNRGRTLAASAIPSGSFNIITKDATNNYFRILVSSPVNSNELLWVDGGGTANAITATYSPALAALVDGQLCFVRATAANTATTPTFSPNGLTARSIVKGGGSPLAPSDIAGDGCEIILRYDLANTRWELLNPALAEDSVSTTFTFNGSGSTSSAVTVTLKKIGNFVTISVPEVTATSGTSSTAFISDSAIPAAFRPVTSQLCTVVPITNNAAVVAQIGTLSVPATGLLSILRDNTANAYTNAATAGVAAGFSAIYFAG